MNKQLILGLTIALGLTGCASNQSEPSMDLADSRWYMTGDFYNIADIKLPAFTLEENDKGFKISGTTGCNNFFGQAEWNGKQLMVNQPIGMTRMLCDDMANKIEMEFIQALEEPLMSDGENLRLNNGAMFKRVPTN
ncbi:MULTISPECIES: META domain-containing protein [unclassified Agarivorans]|uniref:META domain-containing protein n=1 Tax=unclassified Agarivorans TaxID=2636026 RepID=UPI0026E1CC62|nr:MULTISPECIES: META domain-containing protein [unclassified Agarivorans]MDO6686722.1 META domain-containing protein [Agarivorans sp. 3_MG-2023]MDO6716548.1 META domain-containing protein [Agarivorans sp. 2_MG-2023]MDO6765486.1 META domain-containing protein [Agarivorans sp. 1_MG-2023]